MTYAAQNLNDDGPDLDPRGPRLSSIIQAMGQETIPGPKFIPGAKLGDIKDQTRQTLDRIDRLLDKAGTNKSKLLSAQVWLTDMAHFADHNSVWNAWVDAKNPPVRMCVQSPQLWRPGLLVEIMVTAAR